jgi:DNA-binding beta-propeller fold protein YncE
VAVDGSGNIYIADTYNNRVLKETLSEGIYTESTIGSDLNAPAGIAVDGSGNVYVSTGSTDNRVLKETLVIRAANLNE